MSTARPLARLGLLLLLGACRSQGEPVDTGGVDADRDGAPAAIDCDDDDPRRHPEADETCDGVDEDCDGLIDEDALDRPTWHPDADGDGFGSPRFAEAACAAPPGWIEDATDCDDSDPSTFPGGAALEPPPYGQPPVCMKDGDGDGFGDAAPPAGVVGGQDCDDGDAGVHPNAAELCDGVDTDCDALPISDELDRDGDGFVSCAPGELWRGPAAVVGGGDCDDGDDRAFAGATEVCDRVDNDCDGGIDEDDASDAPTWFLDADGDGHGDLRASVVQCEAPSGFVAQAGDCDDGAASTFPGAPERCATAGVDDDCDGQADEADAVDLRAWMRDADGDGAGDPSATISACAAPDSNWVAVGPGADVDCDDTDDEVFPGADERCNGADDDCDGVIDPATASGALTWAYDGDGDGYGTASAGTVACAAPDPLTWVADTSDCDDADPGVSPEADERCDGVDNDCDGDTDEDDALDAVTWLLDADGDGYGGARSAVTACAAPVGFVATGGDCDDGEAAAAPDLAEACGDGIDNDCDPATACAWDPALGPADLDLAFVDSLPDARGGSALLGAGDTDGDGLPDLLIGATGGGPGGRVYLLQAPPFGGPLTAVAGAVFSASDAGDGIGLAAAGLDLDNDGFHDLAVGAPGAGEVSLISGPPGSAARLASDAWIVGDVGVGATLSSAGDTNGDGVAELLIGGGDAGGAGVAWLIGGPVLDLDLSDCAVSGRCTSFTGVTAGDGFGELVVGVGDLDADGLDELAISAADASAGRGEVRLYSGPLSGPQLSSDGQQLRGGAAGDAAGAAVAGGADLDGDGYGDLVISSPGADRGAGRASVLRGPVLGTALLTAADLILRGGAGQAAGAAVALSPDVDGDGLGDVLVGSEGAGLAWLVFGGRSGTVSLSAADVTVTGSAADGFGEAVGAPGDVDGNGLGDLLFGAPGAGTADQGAAWLGFGYGP